MNEFLKHLNRIEFVVTMACTGRCIHCSEGDHDNCTEHIDTEIAVESVRKICLHHPIASVMTFGGEPLLYPDTVSPIQRTAAELGVGRRQVITNGFFAGEPARIEEVARCLAESGVNDLLLSADAFHQETIPLEPVLCFAECAVNAGIPVRLNPAWLVSPEDGNPYNVRTREILSAFEVLGIPVGAGNVVFPSGNALKYLRAYFEDPVTESSPYDEDPEDVCTISFGANGDVLNGNVYQTDILEIMRSYRPD
ncbi:MAG: radical SAM protein [Clostridia bacterium]|nr:radical SAM protein [Clostridia bacterium]